MLEAGADQGASLRRATPRATLRLMAFVHHGERSAQLPLLWQLCGALQDSDCSVAVLDATLLETAEAPGLVDLLDDERWPPPTLQPQLPWPVLPAARGLRYLARHSGPEAARARLQTLFRTQGAVVLYGAPAALASVLSGSEASPLITATAARANVLAAYGTAKQLLQAGLTPTVAALAGTAQPPDSARLAAQALQQCAATHLGRRLDLLTLPTPVQATGFARDARRLALHWLEKSLAVSQEMPTLSSWRPEGVGDPPARRH